MIEEEERRGKTRLCRAERNNDIFRVQYREVREGRKEKYILKEKFGA